MSAFGVKQTYVLHCTCLLLTQSGHRSESPPVCYFNHLVSCLLAGRIPFWPHAKPPGRPLTASQFFACCWPFRYLVTFREDKMKRRQFLTALGAGAAVATIAKPAIAQSSPSLKWRLAASWPKSLDTIYGACDTFSKYVSEATDGKFQFKILPPVRSCPSASARRSPEWHRRGGPQRPVLLHRQGSDLGAILRHSVRSQLPPTECLVLCGEARN